MIYTWGYASDQSQSLEDISNELVRDLQEGRTMANVNVVVEVRNPLNWLLLVCCREKKETESPLRRRPARSFSLPTA